MKEEALFGTGDIVVDKELDRCSVVVCCLGNDYDSSGEYMYRICFRNGSHNPDKWEFKNIHETDLKGVIRGLDDSGQPQDDTLQEGDKFDDGKNRFDLVPYDALEEVVRVYTVGAAKYGDRNWEKGIKFGRVFAAIQRHLSAFWRGEEIDPEDSLSHLAHAAWGCLTLLHYQQIDGYIKYDDRPHQ
jgi:hypothetical protein